MNAALMTSTELAAGFEIEPNCFLPEIRRVVDLDLERIRHERDMGSFFQSTLSETVSPETKAPKLTPCQGKS